MLKLTFSIDIAVPAASMMNATTLTNGKSIINTSPKSGI